MSAELQQIKQATVSDKVTGGMGQRIQRAHDHGPYYVYSPGLPVHRVQERDGLPHCYPNQVMQIETWGHWLNEQLTADRTTMVANDTDGRPAYLNQIWASSIRDEVIHGLNGYGLHGRNCVCAVEIAPFAKLSADEVKLELFNRFIQPEPVWYAIDEVPVLYDRSGKPTYDRRADFRTLATETADKAKELGALMVRRDFVIRFGETLDAGNVPVDSSLRNLYRDAVTGILASIEEFRRWGHAFLNNSDKDLRASQNGGTSGKAEYDPLDARVQWLLARPGVDTLLADALNRQPNVTVQTAPTDVAGIVAAVMTAMEQNRLNQAAAQSAPDVAVLGEVKDDAETLDSAPRRRKTLEEKQAEMREKNSK